MELPQFMKNSPASTKRDKDKQQDDATTTTTPPKQLPKGVVLGKDGKPCRSCTSFASWASMTKKQTSSTSPSPSTGTTAPSTGTASPPPDCPPDVDKLGRHTWTFLHTLSATYPERATSSQAREMSQFLALFSRLYPCWVCAEDLQAWMAKPENEARLQGRSEFGTWLCEAHNEVNRKLGKPEFDCALWEQRWRTGWKDGRCD